MAGPGYIYAIPTHSLLARTQSHGLSLTLGDQKWALLEHPGDRNGFGGIKQPQHNELSSLNLLHDPLNAHDTQAGVLIPFPQHSSVTWSSGQSRDTGSRRTVQGSLDHSMKLTPVVIPPSFTNKNPDFCLHMLGPGEAPCPGSADDQV